MRLNTARDVNRLAVTIREINLIVGHDCLCLEGKQRWTFNIAQLLIINKNVKE